jgi:hypothetical protein
MRLFGLQNQSYDQTVWLEFRNDASTQVPAGGIVRLTGMTSRDDRPILTVGQPNTYGSQYLHFVNGPLPVDANAYGLCSQIGVLAALYDTSDGTPAFGEKWGPRDATWKLKKNTGGFQIVGNVDATNGLVLVVQSPMLSFVGKTDSSHAKSASGTISIYEGTLGSESDTSVNMTSVYNRFLDLDSGAWVRCAWNHTATQWELVAAECP